ncbi:hypothetical protein PSPO01_03394, partial [Paraphaeosphaeria sporulosa]
PSHATRDGAKARVVGPGKDIQLPLLRAFARNDTLARLALVREAGTWVRAVGTYGRLAGGRAAMLRSSQLAGAALPAVCNAGCTAPCLAAVCEVAQVVCMGGTRWSVAASSVLEGQEHPAANTTVNSEGQPRIRTQYMRK